MQRFSPRHTHENLHPRSEIALPPHPLDQIHSPPTLHLSMTPKTDPYATKTQKRVDLFLIAIILVAIFLLLRPTAHGDELVSKLGNQPHTQALTEAFLNGFTTSPVLNERTGQSENKSPFRTRFAALEPFKKLFPAIMIILLTRPSQSGPLRLTSMPPTSL